MSSRSHLVVIPSYNTGPKVLETVRAARRLWEPVWVIVDGSTDGTTEALRELAQEDSGVRVLVLPRNQGKGAAVFHGLEEAFAAGYSHILTMDADGQHPPEKIPEFMAASLANREAMILGLPVFDASVPLVRLRGRKISNVLANLQTLSSEIGDALFGFRVYPIAPLRDTMQRSFWMRRFDFDPEAAVRLSWRGVPVINVPAPVKYLRPEEGGVSHFHYVRDNIWLTLMNLRLLTGFVLRLPLLILRKLGRRP
ncbi:MAG TPA: glycosyltransferase family 2 protein [Burkholderiales bacterium]|nr:glycosyltransferase family 2 protein [Burkholderiales bacterium]